MTRLVFDARTPFLVNGGILVFAFVFAKALGFFRPIGEYKAAIREHMRNEPSFPSEGLSGSSTPLSDAVRKH